MRKIFFLSFLAVSVFYFGCKSDAKIDDSSNLKVEESVDAQTKQKAIDSAEYWLALIDSGNYGESWDEAAGIFKKAITKEKWVEAVENVRSNVGKYLKREIISATYTKTLPGAPDGEYVVIQFNAKFEKKEKSTETITPMKDSDGKWHVSGYYIK